MPRRTSLLVAPLAVLAFTGPLRAQAPNLFYEIDGEGPVIVFLADWAQDTTIWFRILPALRREFRLVRYDLRGQGRSEAPADRDYSIVAHREDLERVLDGLGIEHAHLVGAGFGGAIALTFALEHSERVTSVAVINPHVAWAPEDRSWWERFVAAYERAGRPPLADYTSVLVERWFGSRYAALEPWIVPFCDLMLRRQSSDPLVASLRTWLATELSLAAETRVPVPVFVIWGERAGPPLGEGRLHRALRVSGRAQIRGTGLVPQVEAPGDLAPLLAGFFRVTSLTALTGAEGL